MDHFYQRINGFMNHRNLALLDQAISKFLPGGVWVELGSWTGRSAAYCIVELINQNKLGDFYCIDTWQGGEEHYDWDILKDLESIFYKNLDTVMDVITPIKELSWKAADLFADDSVDFCYVDAGHTYDCVSQDLAAWWPKIRPGSLFGGDDYTKGYADLQRAVWDFFGAQHIKVSRMGRCWVVQKP